MQQTVVINIVGLTTNLLENPDLFLHQWLKKNKYLSSIEPVLPALTCSAQTTYLTGKWPSEHGIVGNGWYDRNDAEVKMWKQSNKLVQSPKIWDLAREIDPTFTCANLFWWYNMYSDADFTVTPRPQYWADGQKKPDSYSKPANLRDRLQDKLGVFPLFDFWGPKTTIRSSEWIAKAAKLVYEWHNPTLTLIYLPHLDYCCQKFEPNSPEIEVDLKAIDLVFKDLIEYFEDKGTEIIVLSEYGITKVSNPIHINRFLRTNGYLQIREEKELELLDTGECRAFALADHQIAHVYIKCKNDIPELKKLLEKIPGVAKVLDNAGKKAHHLDHERAGDLVLVADQDSWFTYYYWLDDWKAPDFARTVEIHKKIGYDPVELFLDPKKKFILPRIILKLIRKKLGFRTLMNVIPLDAKLVKGSHGCIPKNDADKPIFMSKNNLPEKIESNLICQYILDIIFKK
ncbi:alkaline phosphatase family protein [Flavobacterium sp. Fl-77]|uniref:Alkaline phosphatase family protein n=1 Tax=Flavobacterium flavipigmentatum TaxID=2893884 RepID=A0AAJ2VXY0_9FLAO|nr:MULTISPECIES: nucleotide pyrophosphatase/phosphodiesterase family protein [unclassified Flavobacterium]MDX6183404.1 alkaline phosphatase family protein [Flavobacterium sp. Fl-33]MDX6186688.1 alkaline phosphatase family protein [Flavobacterium sp. Fl-77]UFH38544.1 alkaline phosphatase family protein [Flavobacterium sp. F-70]